MSDIEKIEERLGKLFGTLPMNSIEHAEANAILRDLRGIKVVLPDGIIDSSPLPCTQDEFDGKEQFLKAGEMPLLKYGNKSQRDLWFWQQGRACERSVENQKHRERDWFAGQALAGSMNHWERMMTDDEAQRLAHWCFKWADAMLAERKKDSP